MTEKDVVDLLKNYKTLVAQLKNIEIVLEVETDLDKIKRLNDIGNKNRTLIQLIDTNLALLSEKNSEIIRLKYFEHTTGKEMAVKLGNTKNWIAILHVKAIKKLKKYIETLSNIKFDENLFDEIITLNTIRNIFIHNGGEVGKKSPYIKNKIRKFAIMDDLSEDIPCIEEDLKHLNVALETMKSFLEDTTKQKIFI